MVRLENWPRFFSDHLAACRVKPFQWGENDCIMFAAKGIEAITGVNLYAPYQIYNDEAGARDVVKKGGGLSNIVTTHLGPGHRDRMRANRGDLVLMKLPEETIGMVDDTGLKVACVSLQGLVRLPLMGAHRIWGY